MTMVLQPLDRSINFPFKCYLKDKFTSFLLDNTDKIKENLDDCRKRIVKDISEIIYGSNNNIELGKVIKDEVIIKSFQICGITNDMTGDEDYLFDGFDVINKLTISHKKRLVNNGNNTTTFRYVRRKESECR